MGATKKTRAKAAEPATAKKKTANKARSSEKPDTKTAAPAAVDAKVAKIDDLIAKSAKGSTASAARTALRAFSDDDVGPRFVVAVRSLDPKIRSVAVEGGTATPRRRELFP